MMIGYCPDRAVLVRIGRGSDEESCDPAIAVHVEVCPMCQEFLEGHAQSGAESFDPGLVVVQPADGSLPSIDGFTIERELGRGSTGVVYLARRDAPSRHIALKLWPGGRRASDRERRKWLREVEAVSSMRHPNVVTLYDACVTDDWFLLVLEYVPGGTLADRLTQPLAPRTAARLVERIARAIHHIHRSGLLHLDLKPSNILLDGDADATLEAMVPKVSDFGIARSQEAAAADTGGPGVGGTPSYMAPEQISRARSELSAAADVHGLGAILYHALTGRPPYQAATVLETIDQVRQLDAVPPRRLNPGIPRDLETICLKCLHKDPARRYATAEALAEDLSRWLDGRAISARRVSPVEKSWRWCRRRPVIAALSVALLLTMVTGFAVVVDQWRKTEAGLRASMELSGDLMNAITINADYRTTTTIEGRIQLLDRLRIQLLSLSSRRPGDVLVALKLAKTGYHLATELMRAGKFEEARSILLETLERTGELVRLHPKDHGLQHHLSLCLRVLGSLSERLDSLKVSVDYFTRVIEIYSEGSPSLPSADVFIECVDFRRELAWLLWSRGKRSEAARVILGNQHALDHPPDGCEVKWLVVQRLLCRIDSLEMLDDRALKASDKVGRHTDTNDSALSRLAPLTSVVQTPVEWARCVFGVFCSDDDGSPSSPTVETEWSRSFTAQIAGIASKLRESGDIERCRQLAKRMLALANELVEAYPREPTAHLALSLAYAQMYKNAYEEKDDNAVEPNMRLAYDAAHKALRLDPLNVEARHQVDDLHRRLAALPGGG